jgi:probable F420-dependent oxidoreductase
MEFTGLGVFAFLDTMSIAEAGAFAQRVEELGYHALWFTEGPLGRDALVHAASLLTRTKRMIIGTGVASVWARPAATIAAGARTNAEVSGDRFALGIGVNNPVSVAMRGRYVGALKAFKYTVAGTAPVPPIVIGAQNPKMLELAGRLADGALTYFVTPAHTAHARRLLGPGKRLIVEQAVLLESDANKARTCVRDYMAFYLSIPGYSKFLMSLGFDQRDLVEGGSDFLVDAIVAWGGRDALRARLDEHRNAGADQVCILPLDPAGGLRPDLRTLEALASK